MYIRETEIRNNEKKRAIEFSREELFSPTTVNIDERLTTVIAFGSMVRRSCTPVYDYAVPMYSKIYIPYCTWA